MAAWTAASDCVPTSPVAPRTFNPVPIRPTTWHPPETATQASFTSSLRSCSVQKAGIPRLQVTWLRPRL